MNSTTDLSPYGPAEQAGIENELVPASLQEQNYSYYNKSLLKGLIIGATAILIAGIIAYHFWNKKAQENDN